MKSEVIPLGAQTQDLIDFPELARTFGRYKWGIASLTVLAAALSALVAFTIEPTYRGTVTLLIEGQNQRVATLQDVYDRDLPELEFLGSQIAILRSRDLAAKAVDRLDLVNNEEFKTQDEPSLIERLDLRRYLPALPDSLFVKPPPTDEEIRDAVIDEVASRITVEPLGRTQAVKVHFDASSPALAATVANTLADLYIESGLQARLDATTKATSWLTGKLSEIEGKLKQAEAALQRFREQQQLVNVGGVRNLTEEAVLDYSRRLREAQRKRTELESSYEKIRQAKGDPRKLRDISALLLDPVVQRANDNFLSAQEALKQGEERYGPKHPLMATARARLATAEAALNEQLRIAAQGVQTEYEIAKDNERALAQQLEAARAQIRDLDRKDYEMSVLEREVTTYRELYNTFLTRFKETDVAGSYQAITARIIDPAVEPRLPESPKKKRIVLLSALGGMVLGILLAILHYLLSEGVRSAEELEEITQLPVLGVLPLVSSFASRKKNNLPKYLLDHPRTPFAEGIRSICTALRLMETNGKLKRIVVSSSVPEEGKSSVCGTLALTLGASENVVVVETDLRKPSLRRLFDIPKNQKGLAEVLAGDCSLAEALHRLESGSITILTAGRFASNPSETLRSAAFGQLLAQLAAEFDRVILDSPPVQAAADALVIGQQCDAMLFIVKSDDTSRRAIRNALKQVHFASIPLAGVVVNQVDVKHNQHYADSYRYAYGYYG